MANPREKSKDNIPGPFYVDIQCIACDACVEEAPLFFKMNDLEGHAYVYFQPRNEQEISTCIDALQLCPVDAIGKEKGEEE